MNKLPRSVIVILVAGALFLIAVLAYTQLRPYQFHGLALQSAQPAADFTLTASGGKAVKLSDFRGKLVVLYFGYTYCPDVCPTTLGDLARALNKLGQRADGVQVVMVTVDPARDTPEHLADYVSHFDPTFVGLSGTADQIAVAAAGFGIYYQKHEGTAATGYLVDHTATISVLDKEGHVRLVWPFGTPSEDMAADLGQMLR
ncbi:MAG: SCO family protein [Chloroflexi bacterium]|nr:SCO family protein [Chloroflexota bacterium]